MSIKMKAIFANDKADLDGNRFSTEALRNMAETPVPLPLLLNFDKDRVLGKVTNLVFDTTTRELGGEVTLSPNAKIPDGYVPVVGYIYDPQIGDESMQLFAIGITDKPSTPDTGFVGG